MKHANTSLSIRSNYQLFASMPYPSPALQRVIPPTVCHKTSTAQLSCQTLLYSVSAMHLAGNKPRGQDVFPKNSHCRQHRCTSTVYTYMGLIQVCEQNTGYYFPFAGPFPSSQPFFTPLSHCFMSNLYYQPAGTGFYHFYL